MINSLKYPFGIGLLHLYQENKNLFIPEKEPIHIIGNGWATYHFVKELNKNKYIPIIISPNEFVLNTTKLIDYLEDGEKDKLYLKKINKTVWIKGEVKDLDLQNKSIIVDKKNNIKPLYYKNLVLAIGSEINDYGIAGIKDNTVSIKNIKDIDDLRKKITTNNSLKKIIIVGGGPTGIELAYKLNSFGHKIEIIEGLIKILPNFSLNISKKILTDLSNKNILLQLDNKVCKIDPNQVITDKGKYHGDILIWTAGVRFNGYNETKLYNKINTISKIVPRGINVNPDFSIGNNTDIYCIGDIVANKGPPTAQNAKYQAKWLASYFNNDKKIPYEYKVKELGKILHTDNKIYLESEYYSGYICKHIEKLIQFFYKI